MSFRYAKYGVAAFVLALIGGVYLGRRNNVGAAEVRPILVRDTAIVICPHYDPSVYECGPMIASFAANAADIASVTVTVNFKSGATQTYTTSKPAPDAVFLTKWAVRNFLIRYYNQTRQGTKADSLTRLINSHSSTKK